MPGSILCVDDDRNLCQIVAKALRSEGYAVRTATDGDQAIEEIQEDTPDLIFLDVMLPRRDGFEVLEQVRGLSECKTLPVVLMTGCTPTPAYAAKANALGALDLLTKPLPLEKILAVVVSQIGEAKPQAHVSPGRANKQAKGIVGKLDRIPLPAILHHLHGLRATGVLELQAGKKKKWLQLRDGYPIAVRSNLVKETLGHLLVRSGRITKGQLSESRRRMDSAGARQGEILVAMDVLSETDVMEVLRAQADEKLFEAFAWETGDFKFDLTPGLQKANAIGLGRSPANLILEGVRTRFPLSRIDRYFDLHGARFIQHGESPFYRFQEIHVEPEEETLLRGLDGTLQLGHFAEEKERVRRTVYGLLASGLLELRESGRPHVNRAGAKGAAKPAAARPRPQPATERDAADPRLGELKDLERQLRAQTYFEILDVDAMANGDALRTAYERLSSKLHPDRYHNAGEAVRDLAAEVYGMVTEAFVTLSDPKLRQKYSLQIKKKERERAERREGERALEAETEFRAGEVALKTRNYENALAHFGRALQLYPSEGIHHAHYGWALHLCHPDDPSMVGEALEHVKRGVKLARHHEKPYLFMGRLYKTIGKPNAAERMFTRAAQIQPECVEALRELRLIQMRRDKTKGLIGRLLRR
jgi:CheY-like chemotaxis protein/tetratricopeptide (TPR) repeat protein